MLPIFSVQTSFLLVIDIDLTSSMRGFQGILKALVLASNCSGYLNVKKHHVDQGPAFVFVLEQITPYQESFDTGIKK